MTKLDDKYPVVIAGGGIGGLMIAFALGRQGRTVRVLEQATSIGAIGYGIQLGPNVFSALDCVGLADAVKAQSLFPPAVLLLSVLDQSELARLPTGERFRNRFGHPYSVIHRVDLHHVLRDACLSLPNVTLEAGITVSGFKEEADGVEVLSDAPPVRASILIGADGLRSHIRAQIMGDETPVPTGYVAHRTLLPMDKAPQSLQRDEVILWAGEGFHIVQYPLRDRSVLNTVAVFKTPTSGERMSIDEYRAEIDRTYSHIDSDLRKLVALMDIERRWSIADRRPRRGWSRGRVLLLGDAAHPTLQSLAQGAGMAIEDAVCLAALLKDRDANIAQAFPAFEHQRFLRTARIQLESRQLWDSFYHIGGVEAQVRDAIYQARTEVQMHDCVEWIYDTSRIDYLRPGAH